MAQVREVRYVDDIDGSEASETIHFAYRGKSYEIDLNETHVEAFDETMADFLPDARVVKASGKGAPKVARRGPASVDREQTRAVRAWAQANGHNVKDRGRIPASVVEAFQAAR